MSETKANLPALPSSLPALAVLGVSEPTGGDWSRLRGLQYSHLAQKVRLRVGAHLAAALLFIWAAWPAVKFGYIAVWLGLLVMSLVNLARVDTMLGDADRRRMTRDEFHRQTVGAGVLALCWAIPNVFVASGPPTLQLTYWSIIATLIAGSALVLSSAPLGTIVFALIAGVSSVVALIVAGHLEGAVAAVGFVTVAVVGTITGARTHLTARVAEAGMAEKSEVVSLLLREFEENEADWLWQVDTSRRIRGASPRFAFALGRSPEEVDGIPFIQLISGDGWDNGQFPPSLHELADKLKRRENFSNLLVKVTIGREFRWWELSGTPMLDESGTYIGFRGVGSDVTEQRESSEKIAYLARYDTLTGLPNRLMLNEALGDGLRYAEQWRTRCAFLMIDLDRFKAVNDSLGHQIGDRLLAQVSNRLKDVIGEQELCGRLGGDEFAIVIRDASEKGHVERIARTVIDRLSQPYEVDHHTLYVGASVGSALGPRDGSTVEELMRNADLALYRAKDDGGGEHCPYEPALHAMAEERRQLEFSLRRALERDEMLLHYQPVVDANSQELVSFEALLRWDSPEHGFVSPAKFIPLAEDTRLIVPIGTWVLEQACREAAQWPGDVKVNVNASPEQLIEPDFATTVVRALQASGLAPHRLEIEVTESIFLRDANVARGALEQCMALGCSVALDDFGTGYSSLGYLRKLKFSTIKVDRSFVQGAAQDSAESLAIIRAVVAMAQSLEMTTTAEGVETAEEAEMIRRMGCDKIQGYYFGRPMPANEARDIFRRTAALSA